MQRGNRKGAQVKQLIHRSKGGHYPESQGKGSRNWRGEGVIAEEHSKKKKENLERHSLTKKSKRENSTKNSVYGVERYPTEKAWL